MCQKNYIKQFYGLMMTSPKLASPVCIQIFSHHPTPEQIRHVGEPHLQKNREWSLLVHFDEQPQLHVVPLQIPITPNWRDPEPTHINISKAPLLPISPKPLYLA